MLPLVPGLDGRSVKVPVLTSPNITLTLPVASGKLPFTLVIKPVTSVDGIVAEAFMAKFPLALTYPVKFLVPVPPLFTAMISPSHVPLYPFDLTVSTATRSLLPIERSPLMVPPTKESFSAKAGTVGASAVPAKSPASCIFPFTVVLASTVPEATTPST